MYNEQNKAASTAASLAALEKLEVDFKKKLKDHSYDVIGGYKNYCADLDTVMKEYEAIKGLGVKVICLNVILVDVYNKQSVQPGIIIEGAKFEKWIQ